MMQKNSKQFYWMAISIIFSLLLKIAAWPYAMAAVMPQWVLIITLFWVAIFPEWCGVSFAFMVGLLTDVITGSVLGQHACVFVFLSYFALKARVSLMRLPVWQQIFLIGSAALISLLLQRGIVSITGVALPVTGQWISVLTSAFLWLLLSVFSHRFQLRRAII